MARRLHIIQVIIADVVELPPHRVVQRMNPSVAPMAVQSVLRQSGAGSGKFKQLVGRTNGDLCRQHLCLSGLDGCVRHVLQRGVRIALVDGAACNLQQSLGGVQLDMAFLVLFIAVVVLKLIVRAMA